MIKHRWIYITKHISNITYITPWSENDILIYENAWHVVLQEICTQQKVFIKVIKLTTI